MYPYLKHLIELWPRYWIHKISKTNKTISERNKTRRQWVIDGQYSFFQTMSYEIILDEFYLKLPTIINYENSG